MELSIIIPAFNEEERITKTLLAIQRHLDPKNKEYEIIVVDDGSIDTTIPVVQQLKEILPQITVIALSENKGKGHAIKTGMLQAKGNICVFMDADGSTPIYELDALLAPIQADRVKISIGSRYLSTSIIEHKQPRYRRIWSRLSNRIVQRFLLKGIVDPHCGFKAFEKDTAHWLFSKSTIDGWSFDLEILALAQLMSIRIAEHPVRWQNDERSKGRIRHVPREILNVIRIKRGLRIYA